MICVKDSSPDVKTQERSSSLVNDLAMLYHSQGGIHRMPLLPLFLNGSPLRDDLSQRLIAGMKTGEHKMTWKSWDVPLFRGILGSD